MAFGGTTYDFDTTTDGIDLRGLAFTSGTTDLSWTQVTSGANASGTLSVTSGAAVQNLTLLGQYVAANFSATSDGHGGTLITDPSGVEFRGSDASAAAKRSCKVRVTSISL
jgi:hypothetical protein